MESLKPTRWTASAAVLVLIFGISPLAWSQAQPTQTSQASLPAAQPASTLPPATQPTFRGPPDRYDKFPVNVVFPDGSKGTLLPESEVPEGDWRLVSYHLHAKEGKSQAGASTLWFRTKTSPIWEIIYPNSSGAYPGPSVNGGLGSVEPTGDVGPWYRVEGGCLRPFFGQQTSPSALSVLTREVSTDPRGEWLNRQTVDRVCGFQVRASTLTVYLSSDRNENGSPAIVESLTFRRIP